MRRRHKVLMAAAAVMLLTVAAAAALLTHDASCGAPPPLDPRQPSMGAMVYRCYGSPAVIRFERVPKPVPASGEVLVKVAAASVNPLDWHYLRGTPYFIRTMAGIGRPDDIRLGVDFAGTVEAVGAGVTRFKPGDTVFGSGDGSFAEYLTKREQGALAHMPEHTSFAQAASLPVAAVTALQALRDKGRLRSGQSVLINGASGGVGTFAVQIAKSMGARVTGVCHGSNAALVKTLGADHVIDYTREDFTQLGEHYDLIIDNVGNHPAAELRRALTDDGAFVAVGGVNCGVCVGPLLVWLGDSLTSAFHRQKRLSLLADITPEDLAVLADMVAAGAIKPAIDRSYPLSELPTAMAYLEAGHARAKVLIDVAAGH